MQLVNISTIWIASMPLEIGRTRGNLLRLEAVMGQLGQQPEAEQKVFVRLQNLEQRLFDRMCRLRETRGRPAAELCRRTRLLGDELQREIASLWSQVTLPPRPDSQLKIGELKK